MAYLGRIPAGGRFAKLDDISSSFNGSANTFTLSIGSDQPNIASASQVLVSVGGVLQEPETDYEVRTNQIVFTSAPPNGATFFAILLGDTFNTLQPSTASIQGRHLKAGAINSNTLFGTGVITRHAIANGAISANVIITTGSITADLIATGAVGPTELATGAVSANTKIGSGAITAVNLAADSVSNVHIQTNAVGAAELNKTSVQGEGVVFTDSNQTFSKAQRGSITSSTILAANISLDFSLNNHFAVTLANNSHLNLPTNLVAGQTGSIFVVQDGTGSRTLSYAGAWEFPGGTAPTLTTTASAEDRIDYIVRASNAIHAVASLNVS
tara:strand:+ start:1235 stop:2215 length:981 start_codon:yes stop_codon:yes gene_type:complete